MDVATDIRAGLSDPKEVERIRTELMRLLSHQRTLYRRLRLLADRQSALVLGDESGLLLELLAERQRLIDGLTGLNTKLSPYRAFWTEVYNVLDVETRRQIAEILEEANATLGAILKHDGQDCGRLSAKREETAARMAEVETGSRVCAAYSSVAGASGGSVTDTKG